MKGMLQKTVGIIGIFIVFATVVMVALTPRREGFFPDVFTSGEKSAAKTQAETQAEILIETQAETIGVSTPTPPQTTFETLPVPDETIAISVE